MKTKYFEYKMRAECQVDVGRFLLTVHTGRLTMRYLELPMPDVEATFTSPVSLSALRAIMAVIVDGHVMRETVALAKDYTGERVELEPL